MTAALRINGVSKRFGTLVAIDQLSLTIPEQRIYGLIGPNGAGKTTLFSLVCGFLRPDAGSIEACGVDIRNLGTLNGRMGILPQDALFQSNIPILEQLSFFLRLQGYTLADARVAVETMLERVGLSDKAKRRVGTLSHGMIKRLALAQAFLGSPELILLDEPTSGLDPEQSRVICDLIRDMVAVQKSTVVLSSHNLGQLQTLCHEIAVINHGKLVASGPMDDFIHSTRRLKLELSQPLDGTVPALASVAERIRAIPQVAGLEVEATGECLLTIASKEVADEVLRQVLLLLLAERVVPRRIAPAADLESEVLTLLRGDDATAKNAAPATA